MTKNNFFLAVNLNLIWVRFYFDERRGKTTKDIPNWNILLSVIAVINVFWRVSRIRQK